MVVHTTRETEGIPAPAISVFPYSKNDTAHQFSPDQMEEMYSGDLPSEDFLTKITYNQSEALIDIFLGLTRQKSLLGTENIVTEEMVRPLYGRFYVFRPSFKIGTDYKSDQIFFVLSQNLNYEIQVYDPHFYPGFSNPSIPIINEKVEHDGTVGKYYNLILTKVGKKGGNPLTKF